MAPHRLNATAGRDSAAIDLPPTATLTCQRRAPPSCAEIASASSMAPQRQWHARRTTARSIAADWHEPAPATLECLSLTVPEAALEAYEAALGSACETVGFFRDHATGTWRLEGVRAVGAKENELAGALALAAAVTGVTAAVDARADAGGRVVGTHPCGIPGTTDRPQLRDPGYPPDWCRACRPNHARPRRRCGVWLRRTQLDPGLPHGAGAAGSANFDGRSPCRILDLGTGSGILAMAAAKTIAAPGAGDRYRAMVDASGAAKTRGSTGSEDLVRPILADGWRIADGAEVRPLRSGVRQYPGPAAAPDGA